jgi:Cellulase (glycosyl hydrolase family 5)
MHTHRLSQIFHLPFVFKMAVIIAVALNVMAANASADPQIGSQDQGSAGAKTRVVVFWEEGFPAADTALPSRANLSAILPGAAFVSSDSLSDTLASEETGLLVLPYGSAFPEKQWGAFRGYLERGGNLLVLGGKPFTRAVYKDGGAWRMRPAIQTFARTLFLNDYQETQGSDEAKFAANEDFSFLKLPAFNWNRAWSATLRLTDEDLYKREGSSGTLDTRLDPLAWGVANGHRLAAPIVELDHLQNHFVGGRWILVACDLPDGFYASATGRELVTKLVKRAADSAEDFTVQPEWPVFASGEPINLQVHWQRYGKKPVVQLVQSRATTSSGRTALTTMTLNPMTIELSISGENGKPVTQSIGSTPDEFPYTHQVSFPASSGTGLHAVTARLSIDGEVREIYHTGFWMRDESALRSGPKMKVAGDYFTLDDKPILVAGTTYMASDVQRQFFIRPNPWLWNRDMAEIHAAGLNMLRTGWWSAWDQLMKQSGVVREEALRTMEAYLMTARRNGLAVQFNLFAFIPEVLGGENAYLDPEAIRRQKEMILPFVERFHDVPYLAWDLINEPSFSNSQKTWQTRPNGDKYELAAWNAWLNKRYAGHDAVAEAWRSIPVPQDASVPLPSEAEFSTRAQYEAWPSNNSLRAMDYQHFAQDAFRGWASEITSAIRAAGSAQLVTVGQDEGGGEERPQPVNFGDVLDFTTTHSWWAHDAILWDSLVAKLPGKPMLVQETGVSKEIKIDGERHRTLEEETSLLERKLAIAAGTSAGAIEWLWNVNALQRDDRESTIGAVRPDGTEKPEAALLRRFAEFAGAAGPHMSGAKLPEVAIVTSQVTQYSPLGNLEIEAQQKSVRAMNYFCGVPAYVISENQIVHGTAGHFAVLLPADYPKLVVLPSAHALSDEAWNALLQYVDGGGTLLITGSVERDAHWRATQRFAALGAPATAESLLLRAATQAFGNKSLALSFTHEKQQAAEYLHFADGETFHTLTRGKGRIFVATEPIELAEGLQPAAELYAWALSQVGVGKPFTGQTPVGVLVRPLVLADSVLYLIVSESANTEKIAVQDKLSGGEINLAVSPGRAALVLLSRKDGHVLARFGE